MTVRIWFVVGLLLLVVCVPQASLFSQPPTGGGDSGNTSPFDDSDDSESGTTSGGIGPGTQSPVTCLTTSGKNSCQANFGAAPQQSGQCSNSNGLCGSGVIGCGYWLRTNPNWSNDTGEGLTYEQGQIGGKYETKVVNCTVNQWCMCEYIPGSQTWICKGSSAWTVVSAYTVKKKQHPGTCNMD
jgi:hypothetical protein